MNRNWPYFSVILLFALLSARADLREGLDAPLLFTKRHSYHGIHIYDTYYKWPPGGGGIYVLENPAEPLRTMAYSGGD